MGKWAIFSHKPVSDNGRTHELLRHDVDEAMVVLAKLELQSQGHRIVETLPLKEKRNQRERNA